MKSLSLDDFILGFKNKDITFLSRAITFAESLRADHQKIARDLIQYFSNQKKDSVRLGLSGPPGVGKSTFIESFGNLIISKNKTLAVLAIDPSSEKTGGSILGDKTRMVTLSQSKNAFIRPTPSGKSLGGVANKTREALLLCEAFGFDYILVETVGVGQSETEVSKLVDFFLLLMQPGSGDDLQGIKRGILELANIVIVNKADGDLLEKAKITRQDLRHALSILRQNDPFFTHKIFLTSTPLKTGFEEVLDYIDRKFLELKKSNLLQIKREEQLLAWFNKLVFESIHQSFHYHIEKKYIDDIFKKIKDEKVSIYEGVKTLLNMYEEKLRGKN